MKLYSDNWQSISQHFALKIPHHLRKFLLDSSSMTTRLRELSHNNLAVKVLHQGWGKATFSESAVLRLKPRKIVLTREVILSCNNIPCIYGRSVFPETSLKGKNKFLYHVLDHRPLGDILYQDTYLKRDELQLTKLSSNNTQYPLLNEFISNDLAHQKINEFLYGRRSIFIFNRKPLLVTEILLPAMEEYLSRQK